MNNVKYIFLSLIIFSNMAFGVDKLEKVSLQLLWLDQFQFAGYYVAKEKGFYRDVGLDVELKKSSDGVNEVDEVTSRRATYAIGRSSLMIDVSNGAKIKPLAAIFQASPLVLLSLKDSGINSIENFIGKKVMSASNNLDDISLQSMMLKEGLSKNKIIEQKHSFNIQDFIDKKTDLMTAYISNEPFVLQQKGIEFNIFDPKDYGFSFYSDILFTSDYEIKNNKQRAINFKNASIRGWEYAFAHIEESVELILNKYNTQQKSKAALIFEANELKKLAYYEQNAIGNIDIHKVQRIYDIYNLKGLTKNKINFDDFTSHLNDKYDFKVTKEEREYLKNSTFTYAGDPDWLPFEAFDDKGKYVGIISEHIEIIEKKLDLKFKKIITKGWLDTLELSKKVGADIISGDAADAVLSKNYKPIDTYIKNPLVIVTREDHPFVSDLNHLKDKKIAYASGAGYTSDVLKKYPDIEFVIADTVHSGLLGVRSGKYDVFIGTLAMSDYSIVDMGLEGIKISGDTGITMNLTLFINKNKPRLYSIINRTMNSISDIQKHKIIAKWRHSKIDGVIVDYTLVWQVIGLSLFLFFIGAVFVLILKNSNKKLNQLLNTTIEAVLIFKNAKVRDVNEVALDMYGCNSIEEMRGKTALEFVHPSQREFLKKQLKKSQKPYELLMLRNDGTTFPALVRGTYIDKSTRVTTIIDLTQLKEVQKKLEILNSSLESRVQEELKKNREKDKLMFHQNRLAQMGETLSMIAHQWRQPLNNLSMLNQSVKMKYVKGKLNDEFLEYFNVNSDKQIQNMSKTIDDFRDFFKPEKEKTYFYIDDVILDIVSMVEPVFAKNQIAIKFDEEKKYKIYGYPNELGQAILNVMNNAKDALVENGMEDKNISISLRVDGADVVLSVKDNAGGIPVDIIDKAFNPYFSTKEAKNGTGLGLYMTKIIVEEHMDGKINAFNEEKGLNFEIYLKGSDNVVK